MKPTNKNGTLDYIRSRTPVSEQMAALAEEATEAAHAALKCRRTMVKGNPTPISKGTAHTELLVELGDIMACLEVLGIDVNTNQTVQTVKNSKIERWADRIYVEEKKKQSAGNEDVCATTD